MDCRLLYPVQREIEDIVVVKRSGFRSLLVRRIDRPRQQERDLLLTETAMRAQPMSGELTKIVILPPRADNGLAIAEDREIPLPVDRKLELLADRFLVENQFDAGQLSGWRAPNYSKTVVPSNPRDAKGLLIAAIEDPDPVIFLEPKRLYNGPFDGYPNRPVTPWSKHELGEVPDGHFAVSLGTAAVRRQGTALTVLTYGTMVYVAEAAVVDTDVDAEIIDLRTLMPLDLGTIEASVRTTGRCVIIRICSVVCFLPLFLCVVRLRNSPNANPHRTFLDDRSRDVGEAGLLAPRCGAKRGAPRHEKRIAILHRAPQIPALAASLQRSRQRHLL
jgi:hypothetical protein